MAIINSHLDWPATRRITILLSPADLLKRGTHFDLAVAVSVLAAAGSVPAESLAGTAFIGELTLDGNLRSVTGVLPMVLAAAERGIRAVFVPEPQAAEAAMVPDMSVIGVRSLGQVVAVLRDEEVPEAPPVAPMSGARLLAWRGQERLEELDLADLLGVDDARYAVEVAAAGGHHLLLSGPKGSGKTSLAERIPGILPDLTPDESLELSAIHSLAGTLDPAAGMLTRPPFSAPHHDASKASIIGGGAGMVRPGEVSRAHSGVLFLDEFPLFRSDVIEALRQPLESGDVTIARRDESVTLPARGMVVLACNPCPCGDYSAATSGSTGARAGRCSAATTATRSPARSPTGSTSCGTCRRCGSTTRSSTSSPPESSAAVRRRVEAARARQAERYAEESWRLNGQAPGPVLRERWPLTKAGQQAVDDQLYDGRLSRRGATRVHRLAWTVADLRGLDRPGLDEVDTALRLRTGDPLLLSMLERVVMSAPDDDRLARVALSAIAEPGDPRLADLVAGHGARAVHDRLLGDHDVEDLQTDPAARRSATDPRAHPRRRRAARAAVRRPGRPGVAGPARRPGAPRRRCSERGGVPLGLWVRGPVRLDQLAGSVAVVGSRSATTYGADVAAEIAATVGGGRPVRRLGSGVRDRPGRPPRRARRRRTDRRGARLRRRPGLPGRARPADRPHRRRTARSCPSRCPAGRRPGCGSSSRNRLIAALTTGTVVVEAAMRSGALNTANWAARLNRHLLGVPGPVTSAPSPGRAPADPVRSGDAGDLRRRRPGGGRRRGGAPRSPSRAARSAPATG